jgi:uncharacterized coiled-coil protein SlyX
MLDKVNGRAILAEQGKWVARLRDAVRVLDQRLTGLERRMSILEEHLSELTKTNRKMDAQLTSAAGQLSMLSSRLEVLAGHIAAAGKIRIHHRVQPAKNSNKGGPWAAITHRF